VACGYGNKAIVRNINRSVLAGQRIGILGANGQGKSTLVKTISHLMPPLEGHITEGKGLSIGYFAQQEMDVLRPDEGPLSHMIRLAKDVGPQGREQELRDFLGQFRFVGSMVNQEVGSLSGGEKARLVLAMLVWQRPNLLLMDEPTNHLDLTTREALSMALNEFEGTVMLVSHDRALLREVCDEFWLVTAGAVQPFDGDLDDYQKWLMEQSKEAARERTRAAKNGGGSRAAAAAPVVEAKPVAVAAPVSTPAVANNNRDDRKQQAQSRAKLAERTKPLRNQLSGIEKSLAALAAERETIEAALGSGTLAPAQLAERGKRLKQISDEVAELEGRWLGLTDEIEALTV
jgi:ATP-binding cassette subfamily F protein 3